MVQRPVPPQRNEARKVTVKISKTEEPGGGLENLKTSANQKIPSQASPPSPLSRRVSWNDSGATESEGSEDLRAHSKPEADPKDEVFE